MSYIAEPMGRLVPDKPFFATVMDAVRRLGIRGRWNVPINAKAADMTTFVYQLARKERREGIGYVWSDYDNAYVCQVCKQRVVFGMPMKTKHNMGCVFYGLHDLLI